jgi:hypothetical protein
MHDTVVLADPDKFKSREYLEYKETAGKLGLVALGGARGFYGNHLDPALQVGQLANSFMVQMFDASALAPGQMKDKVLAYQEEIMVILTHYLREAMRSERLRIGLELEAAGHSSAAALVKNLPL